MPLFSLEESAYTYDSTTNIEFDHPVKFNPITLNFAQSQHNDPFITFCLMPLIRIRRFVAITWIALNLLQNPQYDFLITSGSDYFSSDYWLEEMFLVYLPNVILPGITVLFPSSTNAMGYYGATYIAFSIGMFYLYLCIRDLTTVGIFVSFKIPTPSLN